MGQGQEKNRAAIEQIIDDPSTHPWTAVRMAKEERDIDLLKRAYRKEIAWRLRLCPPADFNLGNAITATAIAYFVDDPTLIERAETEINRCAGIRPDKTIDELIADAREESASLRSAINRVLDLPKFENPLRTEYEEYVGSDSVNLRASSLDLALRIGDPELIKRTALETYLLIRAKLLQDSLKAAKLPENPDLQFLCLFLSHYGVNPCLGFNNDDYRFAEVAAELAGVLREVQLKKEAGIRVILMCLSHDHLVGLVDNFARRYDLVELAAQLRTNPVFEDLRQANKARNALMFKQIGRDIGNLNLYRYGRERYENALRSFDIDSDKI